MKLNQYQELIFLPHPDKDGNVCLVGLHYSYGPGNWFVRVWDKHEEKEIPKANLFIATEGNTVTAATLSSSALHTPIDLLNKASRGRYLLQSTYIKTLFIVPVIERQIKETGLIGTGYSYPVEVEIHGKKQGIMFYFKGKVDPATFDFQAVADTHGRLRKSLTIFVDNVDTEADAIQAIRTPEYSHLGGDIGACWYDITKSIRRITCGCMHTGLDESIVCGRPYGSATTENGGEYAFDCIVEGNDGPHFCPELQKETRGQKASLDYTMIDDGKEDIPGPVAYNEDHPDAWVALKLSNLTDVLSEISEHSSLVLRQTDYYLYRLHRGKPVYGSIIDVDLLRPYQGIDLHPDPPHKLRQAINELADALCSYERATGCESILILRLDSGYMYRLDNGKPTIPDDMPDVDLLLRVVSR